jgi:hypothetical protein
MDSGLRFRRGMRFVGTRLAEWRMIAWGLLDSRHPVLAHVIPIRRCNLSCTYCNEFDDFSKPVPLEEMFRRIDKLGELGASIITQSGGEPLLHPELRSDHRARSPDTGRSRWHDHQRLSAHCRPHPAAQSLRPATILQISIDNAKPDDISMKSLKVLDQKLVLLARARRISGKY